MNNQDRHTKVVLLAFKRALKDKTDRSCDGDFERLQRGAVEMVVDALENFLYDYKYYMEDAQKEYNDTHAATDNEMPDLEQFEVK